MNEKIVLFFYHAYSPYEDIQLGISISDRIIKLPFDLKDEKVQVKKDKAVIHLNRFSIDSFASKLSFLNYLSNPNGCNRFVNKSFGHQYSQ